MFSNSSNKEKAKKSTESSKKVVTGPSSPSTIGQGTEIHGKITGSTDIRIDGKLLGDIECSGKIIIGPSAYVQGTVSCNNAIIEGVFSGKIHIQEKLVVMKKAQMEGEIVTKQLEVQSGAIFNVNCQMSGKKIKSFTREIDEKGEVVSLVN